MLPAAPRDWEEIGTNELDRIESRRRGGDLGGVPTMGGITWVGKLASLIPPWGTMVGASITHSVIGIALS